MKAWQKRALHDFSRGIIRSTIVVVAAVGWFLLAGFLFLNFLPLNFNYYNTLLSNQGTTRYDVWFFWAWIPTLLILVGGMLWASGVLGMFWDAITA